MKKIKMVFALVGALIAHPFEWCFIQGKEYLQRRSEIKQFNNAVKLADHKHKSTGKRFHVLPRKGGILEVVDNSYIKHYNKFKGVKKITVYDLLKMARYSTK